MKYRYPKFSVLMTIYVKESPKNFQESLLSLENQTVMPNEIVIVEDGKLSEQLEEILNKHTRKFNGLYKIIKLKKNHGRGYASRVGIDHISNKWFARMDSDDISEKNRFELQISEILRSNEKYRRLAVIGGQISEFVKDKEIITGCRKVPQLPNDIRKFAAYRSPMNNPTVMINKDALLDVGSYSTLNVLEDYDLWIRFLSKDYQLINVPDVLVRMRVGNGMYARRGGIDYLKIYVKQKIKWKKMGIGTNKTIFISSLAMIANVMIPAKLRKYVYRLFLHK
ncbi:glycosyltransferase [Limosilactobacillus vaginalis]|uniref:glycosyltransferase n=1 Tax=Limosilactobacillus vaginalis TaxID=1633 RepID=UPI0025A36FB8|nr:glycosyltransferase [Limosilactobacillus vaginalis]MDM8222231.1 glycosyltransferase [Limosilactobacillus vaginalis]MDM8264764.1 glycosyltransferase [Limosilactobacillus vaginalis]